ncbi:MAG: ATP-binding protein [Bacteroidota bacterium]|nr:ATP-binding protein [Bacteroidota bacterium]
MHQRTQIQVLAKRLEREPRKFIQVIYGPRQVGKTTLVNQFLENTGLPYYYISADAVPAGQGSWIEQQWTIARMKLKNSGSSEGLLIIDEVQKIENWSETVKKEWDADSLKNVNLKVVLLGSSRLLLQKGLSESLAGRYEKIYMGHWSFSEMNKAFGLNVRQYVWYGGYPGPVSLMDDEERWKSYVAESLIETSISKDILMLTRVDKPALLRRLFELGCHYSGQILSFTKILGQLQDAGNTTTLANYLHALDTAGLLKGIEKFGPEIIRQRASSPKFQVHNTALMSAQQSKSFSYVESNPEIWGRWVESAVGAHLLNYSLTEKYKLYFWRHRNAEIDFVIERDEQVVGLEVKSGMAHKAPGMNAFRKKYNPHKIYLVGNTGIPWEEFLLINPVELF